MSTKSSDNKCLVDENSEQNLENKNHSRKYPFKDLKIKCHKILKNVECRTQCPKCKKSRKFFCYSCHIPVASLSGLIPNIKLPIKIDIIKHKNEIDGKSTATHAAIIAPEDVRIYEYPDIPDYSLEEGVVLIFPSSSSVSVSHIFGGSQECELKENYGLPKGHHMGTLLRKKLNECVKPDDDGGNNTTPNDFRRDFYQPSNLPIKRAVFIDSTWNQCRGIYKDERISSIKSVVLEHRLSQFWRHQKKSPRWYLATVEAIHQFLLELHINAWGINDNYLTNMTNLEISIDFIPPFKVFNITDCDDCGPLAPYNGQYDNLLFFFIYMYDLIHMYYDHEALKSYKRPFY